VDFTLSEEQRMLRDLARQVARDKVAPRAAELDRSGEYPQDIFAAFKETGLLGVAFPEQYGGAGAGITGLCLAVEEVAKYCNASALILLLTRLPTSAILFHGTEEQKQHYCRGVAEGRLRGAFGLTEPGAGSDAANIQATARRDGDAYILNGTKTYISGATVADFFLVAAKTDPRAGARGMSAFIVERDTPGFSISKPLHKMGVHGIPITELHFQDARVPASALVGPENQGFKVIMANLNALRPVVAARGLGTAEGALAYALDYAKQRETFGKPIAEHQWIQFTLAELAMGCEAGRWLTYKAAWLVDQGKHMDRDIVPHLSMAKAFNTELAVRASGDAVQIMGGAGYMAEFPMERFYRDAKQLTIVEGTSQVQRLIIGKALLDGALSYW
jgi:alkylation response protein AidB-like acyl-CoA dehydrogenase